MRAGTASTQPNIRKKGIARAGSFAIIRVRFSTMNCGDKFNQNRQLFFVWLHNA
jgi:hypothetical protein